MLVSATTILALPSVKAVINNQMLLKTSKPVCAIYFSSMTVTRTRFSHTYSRQHLIQQCPGQGRLRIDQPIDYVEMVLALRLVKRHLQTEPGPDIGEQR